MGFIRQRNTKNGAIRFQTEIRLKGHKTLTATFDRKTDDKDGFKKSSQKYDVVVINSIQKGSGIR